MACRLLPIVLLLFACAGCQHRQLAKSTVLTTSTVMDIQYGTVLTNLAMMSQQPAAYPSHVDLLDGVVQVNDRAGFGEAGGFTWINGSFGIEQIGPRLERQVTGQWGADAKLDPERLTELQELYRAALGLPPLPPPNSIRFLREREERRQRQQQRRAENGNGNGNDNDDPSDRMPDNGDDRDENGNGNGDDANGRGRNGNGNGRGGNGNGNGDANTGLNEMLPDPLFATPSVVNFRRQPSPESPGGEGSVPDPANDDGNGDEDRKVPIEILLSDVPPPGWYMIGGKADVPKNACYVGCYNNTYAWVTAEGVPDLARFTLTVLAVIKFDPDAEPGGGGRGGLTVTR